MEQTEGIKNVAQLLPLTSLGSHPSGVSTGTIFINDLDDGMRCIFGTFVHDLKMGGASAIQSNLDKLEK